MALHDIKHKWALVTGASRGIGAELATLLAERGANLVLAARGAAPMEALAATLRARHGIEVLVEPIDLARPGVGVELSASLARRGIAVDILINNAGFGLFGDFHAQPVARGGGHILLVASILGYQATPGYAAYVASKAYVLQFGEALQVELASRNVKVCVLSPGVTRTAFMDVSGQAVTGFQRVLMMRPRPVAEAGLAALLAGRAGVMPGLLNRMMVLMNRIAPRALQSRIAGFLMTH